LKIQDVKLTRTEKKGFDWAQLLNFTSELAKIAVVAGITAYVSEAVKCAVQRHRESDNVVEFPVRKVA
jgi:hypothetical protein